MKSDKYNEVKKDNEREKWISGLRDGWIWTVSGTQALYLGETCKYVVQRYGFQ